MSQILAEAPRRELTAVIRVQNCSKSLSRELAAMVSLSLTSVATLRRSMTHPTTRS